MGLFETESYRQGGRFDNFPGFGVKVGFWRTLILLSIYFLSIGGLPGFGEEKRETVTFIMGRDAGRKNGYFSNAAYYYRHHPKNRTDRLVIFADSLLDIRNYLRFYPPKNNKPWGRINIVAHGNQWTGLDIPVAAGIKRTKTASLRKSIDAGLFRPLPATVLDGKSEIRIEGCAVGKDRELMKTLREAFSGNIPPEKRIQVESSKDFMIYESVIQNGNIVRCERRLAKYWYVFYPTGYRPGDIRLARRFRKRYPDMEINWREALKRSNPRYPGDLFHHEFIIPVKWIFFYENKNERPELKSEKARETFLKSQNELMSALGELNIPFKYFQWRTKPIRYRLKDGSLKPAVKATGRSTILCTLQY